MEAWQARSAKQQEFVKELAREVRDCAEGATSYEVYIAEFLVAILRGIVVMNGGHIAITPTAASRQFSEMAPRIMEFCRVSSEQGYIAYLLFQKLEPALGSLAQGGYLRDQVGRSQKVFGAPSAMSEVDG